MADEKLLSKVRGLLDKANSTEFPAERDALLAKAEALMQQHEIEMADLDASRPSMQREVAVREIRMPAGEFSGEMRSLLAIFASQRGVQYALRYRSATHCYYAQIVGFEDDLGFVELLYTTTMLDFSSKITPSWDPRSAGSPAIFDKCVRDFKEAGHKWVEIAHMANRHGGNPRTGQPGSTVDGAWLKAAYRRECVRLGVAPTRQTQRHAAFRATFASGYVVMINERVQRMARAAQEASGVISGNLPAVRDSRERVNEKFYEMFPHMRPATDEEIELQRKKYRAEAEQADREREEFLASMTPTERETFLRQEQRRQAREEAQWDRETRARHDESGWHAGQRAAKQVDLSGGVNHLIGKKEIK